MKNTFTLSAALLLTTSIAQAGGLDRSGQSIAPLFEDGQYAELSFGGAVPSVSGALRAAPTIESGNVAKAYLQYGLAYKADINDQFSYALILDQPFGANVSYGKTDTGYPLDQSEAEFRSIGLTALGRYKFDGGFSVHGGVRIISIDADATVNVAGAFDYDASYDRDTQAAFVAGAAYERPDIALRVALTYTSEAEFSHDTTYSGTTTGGADVEGETEYTIPQSVNLDFQSGVAENTLVFGSVRWVEWTEGDIESPGYPANPLIDFTDDVITYNIGVGRQFTDEFAASVSVGYEEQSNSIKGNLSPTDGFTSVSVGGAYTLDTGIEISGGVRYIALGDATTNVAEFEDNSAIGAGIKIAYNY